MKLKLYVIPGSHPCVAVEGALKLKGLDYDRVDLLPGISPLHQLAVFGTELRLFARDREAARRALGRLPEDLDRLDSLIADGTIGGDQPSALDFEFGSSVRLLQCFEDLRDAIDTRPCGELARRLFPSYPGSMPAGALPADWIPDL